MSKARELAELGAVYDSGALSNRNIVINGAQTIDQRNSGSAITMTGSHQYATDRFICRLVTSSSSTFQRVADAPSGYYNSMKVTIGTGATPSSSDGGNYFSYIAEGQDTSHFNWGGSNAKTVTLSFWVKCSIAGSFSIMIGNNALNRGYPASYTINSANTWEYKTLTVAGDTSGTWPTDNTGGLRVIWDWGNGSNFKGSANAWASGDLRGGATGGTALCATSSATWQITGVQIELGTEATPFEHRSFGDELARCKRYYERFDNATSTYLPLGMAWGSNEIRWVQTYTEKRAAPAVSTTGSIRVYKTGGTNVTFASPTTDQIETRTVLLYKTVSGLNATAGDVLQFINDSGVYQEYDAEL